MFFKFVFHSLWGAAMLVALDRPALAETLTAEVLEQRIKARNPEILAAEHRALVAEAQTEQFSLLPNPALGWEREDLPGLERQDIFKLSVPLELSGRRRAGRALARSEAALARAEAAVTRSALTEAALGLFYEALAAERRVAIARSALERLEEAGRVLGRREAEGVASGYDVHRLGVQIELARATLERGEAELGGLRQALALLSGSDQRTLELRGSLAVEERRAARGARRAVREARKAASDARSATDAAESAWIPALEVSGGLRIVETGETYYGYVAGASIELPIFSRGQELRAEARVRERQAEAEALALEQRASLDEMAARQELGAALAEVERLRGPAAARAEKLLRAAQSSYREGARPLLELLDAAAMVSEVELRRVDAELRAKRAELKLRAARGEFE